MYRKKLPWVQRNSPLTIKDHSLTIKDHGKENPWESSQLFDKIM